MDYAKVRDELLQIAREGFQKGPGWGQQASVLRAAMEKFNIGRDADKQQKLLTCWHDLFKDGELSWGLNVDNPGPPFFHIPDRRVNF